MAWIFSFLKWIGLILLLLTSLLFSWVGWQYWRDPVQALMKEPVSPDSVHVISYPVQLKNENRTYLDVEITRSERDTIRWSVSLPDSITKPLPVVFILGGLEIGRNSLTYVEEHGQAALMAYEYPYSPTYWYEGTAFQEIPAIRSAILSVPAQVTEIIRWIHTQSWVDTSRISILGYSFGAFFIPGIYRVLEENNLSAGPAVLAYGGMDLNEVIRVNMKNLPDWQRVPVSFLAAASIRPIEPALHLPYLNGNKLFINGTLDNQIPFSLAQQMQALAPEPKTIINLEEGHMHPRKTDLNRRLVQLSREWLVQAGALGE